MTYIKPTNINEVVGAPIIEATGLTPYSDCVEFKFLDGRRLKMFHDQDCCESVQLEEIIGDPKDLQDAIVIDAREETSDTDPEGYEFSEYRSDSCTWTFYIIQTNKGAVTLRWLGESNGYYSESVDILLLEPNV